MKKILLLFIGIYSTFAIFSLSFIWSRERKADYQQMRAYRISRMTDAQIRQAAIAAQNDFTDQHARYEREKIDDARMDTARFAACRDPAYKERNPYSCSIGLRTAPLLLSSGEFYEMEIMGACMYVDTVREARKYGCLPP